MWRPFKSRRVSGEDTTPAPEAVTVPVGDYEAPEWVINFRLWGVPLAAIAVLVLCAPGEQHIAELSGWHGWISWGLAGLFTLYAGLAAVISTQLPKGSRGKASSIVGAVISLALAMAAQPISHLFVTGYLTAAPKPPLWLVTTVSCVPPFILGHLLHFAAMPSRPRRRTVPVAVSQPNGTPAGQGATVTPLRPRRTPQRPVPAASSPSVSLSKTPSRPALVAAGTSRPSIGARALSLLQDGTPEDKVAEILRTEYVSPDGTPPKANTVRKSISRAQDKLSPRP